LKVVFKLGKFLFPLKIQTEKLKDYVKMFEEMFKEGKKLLIVTGGGEVAREYIRVAREYGLDEATCDQLGIEVSRLNAYLLLSMLGENAYPEVPKSLREVKRFFHHGKIVVCGGLTPGHSTTAVGALAAEVIRADCYVIATDVDGIYTRDPKIYKDAEKLEVVDTSEVFKMASQGRFWAGTYELDPLAIKVIERSKIPTYFIDGRKTENLKKVLAGEKIGTYIKPKQ